MEPAKKSTTRETLRDADEVLRRSREAISGTRKIKQAINDAKERSAGEKISDVADGIYVVAATVSGIKHCYNWMKENVIEPVAALPYIGPALTKPPKLIYKAYYNFTHPYDGESLWQASKNAVTNPFRRTTNGIFNLFRKEKIPFSPDMRLRGPLSKQRAGAAALLTAWAVTGALSVPIAGDSFNYLVAEPMVDLTRISLTVGFNGVTGHGLGLTHDTLYFGIPTKETGDDIYHVTASTHKNSSEESSVSFEVRNRLVHEAWSWANGHGPYRPDFVVGPIRTDSNKCQAISYGSRFRIARWASLRPDLLNVACESSAAPTGPGGH